MPRRRSPGEGSIRFLKQKGVYEAAVVIGYKDDAKKQPIRKSKTFDYFDDAVSWIAKLKGKPLKASRLTVTDWSNEFLLSCERRGLAPSTRLKYQQGLEDLAPLGNLRIVDLTPYHAHTWWQNHMIKKNGHHKYKTLQGVKAAFNEASKLELIEDNPFRKLSAPQPKPKTTSRWSAEDTLKIINYAKKQSHDLYAYLHLAITTGMRRSELLGLQWKYVDFEKGCIFVEETVTYTKGSWTIGPPKTESSRRTIYLDPESLKVLEQQRDHIEKIKKETRYKTWQDYDLVFPSSLGTPVSESRFLKAYRQLCKDAGVPAIRLYDTRATYVSLSDGKLLDAVAAKRSGHSVEMRRSIYRRTVEDEEKSAALSLEDLTADNRR
jgi:integrase